jgi:hypothetical protein
MNTANAAADLVNNAVTTQILRDLTGCCFNVRVAVRHFDGLDRYGLLLTADDGRSWFTPEEEAADSYANGEQVTDPDLLGAVPFMSWWEA